MTLLGPGVKHITAANTTKANRSCWDMQGSLVRGSLVQDFLRCKALLLVLYAIFGQEPRPLRQQHDRDAAYHDDHSGQPRRAEPLAEGDTSRRGADERHQ